MDVFSDYCEIRFSHGDFGNHPVNFNHCNGTILRLRAIGKESKCYTTQLTITTTDSFFPPIQGSIQCSVGTRFGEILIGTVALTVSSHSKCHNPNNLIPGFYNNNNNNSSR